MKRIAESNTVVISSDIEGKKNPQANGWVIIRPAVKPKQTNLQQLRKAALEEAHEKEYRIYIRGIRKWVAVDREYYIEYRRETGAFKKKQYRHGMCACPFGKEYMCDCDCLTCPFYRKEMMVSLDAPITDDEGNEDTPMDRLVDVDSLTPEEALLQKDETETLHKATEQLSPTQQVVVRMMMDDKTQVEVAHALGLKTQSTVSFHKEKALDSLRCFMGQE